MNFICSLPVIGLLFNMCLPPEPLATGYVEGDYVLIAPIEVVQIAAIPVKRGDHVEFGQPVALLERRDAEIAVAQAKANIAQAESQLANLTRGARPEKIETLKASIAAAQFNADEAKRDMERQEKLVKRGTVSKSRVDQAHTAFDVALAKVQELKANLAYVRLPAREDEIAAARAAVEQAKAALDAANWRLNKRTLDASQAGLVVDVIRDLGEVAGPQAPILSILPDNGTKLRLYLPEKDLALISVGSLLDIECDSCEAGLTARVNYIAEGPEFTPPVIYSLENRQKLVYQIEAKPQAGSSLKPGQIISVRLSQKDSGSGK